MDRSDMLELLHKLKKPPYVSELGDCVAGFDVEVATANGAGTACWAWGSRSVEGPTKLSKRLRDRLAAYDPESDDEAPGGLDEDDVALFQAMIRARCEPGVAYYHVLTSEDGDRYFSTSYEKVYEEWACPAVDGAELTPWEEMDDEQLEEWIGKLGLNRKTGKKSRRARPER